MKTNKFFLGLLACASLCACSNDESGISPDNAPNVFAGDEAYISVRLADAGTLTRATTTDPGYEYGTPAEHTVGNAYFYFYDADGVFVSEGSAWNGGNATTENPNIEFKSNTVVVLKGLTKKNYPKYMVTVLNRPDNLTTGAAPTTLNEMEKKLAGASSTGISDGNGNFAMSTTSWAGQTNTDGKAMKYFVTEVKEENFSLEPVNLENNTNNYVTVYVERLAAKVTLAVSNDLTPTTIDNKTYYKIKATVAGEGNDDDVTSDQNQMAAEDLYIEILGWKLNATAKNSRLVKNINEAWENTADGALGFVWNKPVDFRSFWGMSFNYGDESFTYPTTGVGYDANNASCPLNYFSLNNNVLGVGNSSYCPENTNTSDIVTKYFPSAVTSVLLKARICDAEGNPLDLVRFNGLLFKKASFLEYILNVMNAKSLLNVWVEAETNADGEKKYEQIGKDYVQLVNVGDGQVKVELNVPENVKLYARSISKDGKYVFTEIDDFTTINTDLATESGDAIGYTGGLMYYNIPIEHLNNSDVTNGIIPEAKYGVVRNHHYLITVNKLENIGKGIFDPDEVIVPDPDDDVDSYYVGANINILSWKIVNQNVDL